MSRDFFRGVDLRDKSLVLTQDVGAYLLEEQLLLRVTHRVLGPLKYDSGEQLAALDRR